MSQQPKEDRRVTRSTSRAAQHQEPETAPITTQEGDSTLLSMPGTMPSINIHSPTPQWGRSFLRPQDTQVGPRPEEDNPLDNSTSEIEEMTRIISDPAEQITDNPEATTRPEIGIRLTQPRLPNPITVISEAIKEGLINLQHSTLLEIRRSAEPSQRGESIILGLVKQLQDVQTSATNAQGNSWHAHQTAQQANSRLEATKEILKELNKVLVSQENKLTNIEEKMGAVEQRITNTANALETLTTYLRDLEKKEQQTPCRKSAKPQDDPNTSAPESDDEGIFAQRSFARESTAHPKGATEATEEKIETTLVIPKEARAKRPDPFSGKKGKEADTYILKMDIYFNDYGKGIFSDNRKISSTLMNIAPGEATNWAQPLLKKLSQQEDREFLRSWKAFKTAFLLNFSDPIKKDKAIRELAKLSQIKSAQNYASQFRLLIQEVEWNQDALVEKFKEGLKPEV